MEFTSPRKFTLAGFGHVIVFGKGDTHAVPACLHQEALAQGLEPAGVIEAAAPAPSDEVRIESVKTAMKLIAERNDKDDFDASGTPKVRAIEALTDGAKPVDNKERQALWAEVVASVGV